jgi:dipeptidase
MKAYAIQTGKAPYGISAPRYDARRVWRGINLLAPSAKLDRNEPSMIYPLFVKPDRKLTPKDILMVLGDNYEGTEFDQYGQNKEKYKPVKVQYRDHGVVTGHGVDKRFQINEKRQYQLSPAFSMERPIGIARSHTNWCAQLRSWMPNPIGGVLWTGISHCPTTAHVPFYSGITRVPDAYGIGSNKRGWPAPLYQASVYDGRSAYWIFRVVSNLVNLFYTATKDDVIPVWRAWEDALFTMQPSIEKATINLYQANKNLAIEFITNYSYSKATEALEMAKTMTTKLHTIIAHYSTSI